MRLASNGTTGKHENYTAINFDNKMWYNENNIGSKKFFYPHINDYLVNETERRLELDTDWAYILFDGDTQVYEFRSYYRFAIVGVEFPIVEQDIRSAINESHKEFQNAFEEKRREHGLFKPISNLSDEMIQKIHVQLMEVLLPLQAS